MNQELSREIALKLMLWPRKYNGGCTPEEIDAATAYVQDLLQKANPNEPVSA